MPRNPAFPGSDFPSAVDDITNQPTSEIPDAIRAVQLALMGGGPVGTGLGGMTLGGHLILSPHNTYDVGTNAVRPRSVYASSGFIGTSIGDGGTAQITLGVGGSGLIRLNSSNTGAVVINSSTSSVRGNSGAPPAGLGADGDFYFRSDTPGTALQRIYVKTAGAWTGIV